MNNKKIFQTIALAGFFSIALNANAQVSTDSLILYLPMDGNATDLSGNNNDGTVFNVVGGSDRFGLPNRAFRFNGIDSYIEIPASPSMNKIQIANEITITAWINIRQWYANWNVFAFLERYNPNTDAGWGLEANWASGGILFLGDETNTANWIGCDYAWNLNRWCHIGFTYSQTQGVANFYVNGVNVCSKSYTANINIADTTASFAIGRSWAGPDEYSDGLIDELKVYYSVLSPSEIITSASIPTITSFTPTSGQPGATVTITGTYFDANKVNNTVMFNGVVATVASSTPTNIVADVPTGATSGKITVTVGGITATSVTDFTVTSNIAPIISAQVPISSPEETALTILVTDLTITDPDNSVFTLTVQGGTNYSFVGNTLTPSVDFNGTLTIPVTVSDGTNNSAVFNALVTITPVNDAPVITGQVVLTTTQETDLMITITNLTITDPDNTTFTLTVQGGANYSITSGSTIKPAQGFLGTLSVPVSANDGTVSSNVFPLVVTVVDGVAEIVIKAEGVSQVNGSNITFTSTSIGAEIEKQFIIENTGTGSLVITGIQFTGNDFSLKSQLPDPILPATSATLVLNFTPTSRGDIEGKMNIFSNGDVSDFEINLLGEGLAEIEVFNIITTNANGKHDFLKIKNIEFFPGNVVQIYNRWGDKMTEIKDYNNQQQVFRGLNDKGNELPENTYYYLITTKEFKKPLTGFFLLKR